MKERLMPAGYVLEDERGAYLARYHGLPPDDLHERVRTAYGLKCACCGHDADLTIDHIKPLNGAPRRSGLWRWLWRNGCPKDNYQLLCRNCNELKSNGKECPHRAFMRHFISMTRDAAA
jgi:hypothetical protein